MVVIDFCTVERLECVDIALTSCWGFVACLLFCDLWMSIDFNYINFVLTGFVNKWVAIGLNVDCLSKI